jgi:transaldolase / glucose-6-phosphate isomerase
MPADHADVARLESVRAALAERAERDAVRRLTAKDATLWTDDEDVREKIVARLGWIAAAPGSADTVQRLEGFAASVAADGLSRVVLAGMGGSSLAPEVFSRLFEGRVSGAQLTVLDSTHPEVVRAVLDDADLSQTLVIVSSKSGGTQETRCFGARAQALIPGPHQLVAITDPGSALESEAFSHGYREVFRNPPDIGGRFSALSLFGMVPAALVGVDLAAVWERAGAMLHACTSAEALADNPGALLGAYMAGLARAGRDKLTLLAAPELAPLVDWVEQLVAESTGKRGVGIVPVVGEPAGEPARYGEDRAFVALRFAGVTPPGAQELRAAGQPVLHLDVPERLDVGAEFVRWEVATALAGGLLGVNPFDEPDVAESKANTDALLEELRAGGTLPAPEDCDLSALLAGLRAGDYFSVQAFLEPSGEVAAALQRLRVAVRDRWGVATTVGWGPRFLHSSGQLHKGGPDSLVALQLVDATLWEPHRAEAGIPGRHYDFSTLVRAQAVGDLRSLRRHERRIAQVGVADVADIERLAEVVAGA